jgi:hypothetical protein
MSDYGEHIAAIRVYMDNPSARGKNYKATMTAIASLEAQWAELQEAFALVESVAVEERARATAAEQQLAQAREANDALSEATAAFSADAQIARGALADLIDGMTPLATLDAGENFKRRDDALSRARSALSAAGVPDREES